MAAKDGTGDQSSSRWIVYRFCINGQSKANHDDILKKKQQITTNLTMKSFLFLCANVLEPVKGNIDEIVDKDIGQSIH